jgi:antirestriction protein
VGLVIVILIVIGGLETIPRSQVEQMNLEKLLAYVKNQEKEGKALKQMSETHQQKMSEMRKGTDALGHKFDLLSEMVTEMIKDYGQIKQVTPILCIYI